MQPNPFFKAGLLAVTLMLIFLASWETYWRSKGYTTTFDDGEPLWADKRAQVYKDPKTATVFIGSSRIKFDLDIPTWENITNDKAVQLAIEGNSPLPVLHDLAQDENFKGKLVIDVTEGLFFSNSKHDLETPQKHVDYFKKYTPTQRFSFKVNHLLESRFAFLNKDYLSINGLFYSADLPKRPKVFAMPYFPPEFSHVTFERQNIIEPKFLTDTSLQNQVTGNWLFFASLRKDEPPMKEQELIEILDRIKKDIDQIKKRGGQVLFVRTPSSGPFLQMERMAFSRDKFWDRLLKHTNTAGIHFEDYEETSHFICPEWSHLSQPDAVIYTKHFIRALEEKGWHFPQLKRSTAFTKVHP